MGEKSIVNDGVSVTGFDTENIQLTKKKEGTLYPRKKSAKVSGV
jgi:hypothetical protein